MRNSSNVHARNLTQMLLPTHYVLSALYPSSSLFVFAIIIIIGAAAVVVVIVIILRLTPIDATAESSMVESGAFVDRRQTDDDGSL